MVRHPYLHQVWNRLVKRKKKLSSGKRSKFEEAVAEQLQLRGWRYESEKIKYKIPESEHTYTPDFSRPEDCSSKAKSKTVVESKGRFRSRAECDKYIHIRDSNPSIKLVFVFQNPRVAMPGAKRRKDGTIYTMADWAECNNFDYYTLSTLFGID